MNGRLTFWVMQSIISLALLISMCFSRGIFSGSQSSSFVILLVHSASFYWFGAAIICSNCGCHSISVCDVVALFLIPLWMFDNCYLACHFNRQFCATAYQFTIKGGLSRIHFYCKTHLKECFMADVVNRAPKIGNHFAR